MFNCKALDIFTYLSDPNMKRMAGICMSPTYIQAGFQYGVDPYQPHLLAVHQHGLTKG